MSDIVLSGNPELALLLHVGIETAGSSTACCCGKSLCRAKAINQFLLTICYWITKSNLLSFWGCGGWVVGFLCRLWVVNDILALP